MDKTNSEASAWRRMRFKKNKVWVHTDGGRPVKKNGKVLMKYRLDQEYEYWVHANKVLPLSTSPSTQKESDSGGGDPLCDLKDPPQKTGDYLPGKDAVLIYVDGASSGNPGPAGVGVVLQYHTRNNTYEKEISKYIGNATNNVAELEAIRVGLETLKTTALPVRIFTDSNYAYGLLTKGWKPKKNMELVAAIRALIMRFKDLQITKVRGHAGVTLNERADALATSAVKNRA